MMDKKSSRVANHAILRAFRKAERSRRRSGFLRFLLLVLALCSSVALGAAAGELCYRLRGFQSSTGSTGGASMENGELQDALDSSAEDAFSKCVNEAGVSTVEGPG